MAEALIGVIGALIGTTVGVLGTLWTQAYKHASDVVQKRLDLRLRQLNEFYSPLYVQRRRAQAQRARLPTWADDLKTERWRLVDHIEDARANADYSRAVETILSAGEEMVTIIMERSGLVAQDRLPDSFQRFVDHHDRLRRSWEDGKSQPKGEQLPFPGQEATEPDFARCFAGSRSQNMDEDIDCAIVLGLEWVRADISAMTSVKEYRGSPIFEPLGPISH